MDQAIRALAAEKERLWAQYRELVDRVEKVQAQQDLDQAQLRLWTVAMDEVDVAIEKLRGDG
jgi:hypothetical protein